MTKYKAYITVYHCIQDIEADSVSEAREYVSDGTIWDDHIRDVIIDIEEMTDENNAED